jgi:hypothetical protein
MGSHPTLKVSRPAGQPQTSQLRKHPPRQAPGVQELVQLTIAGRSTNKTRLFSPSSGFREIQKGRSRTSTGVRAWNSGSSKDGARRQNLVGLKPLDRESDPTQCGRAPKDTLGIKGASYGDCWWAGAGAGGG